MNITMEYLVTHTEHFNQIEDIINNDNNNFGYEDVINEASKQYEIFYEKYKKNMNTNKKIFDYFVIQLAYFPETTINIIQKIIDDKNIDLQREIYCENIRMNNTDTRKHKFKLIDELDFDFNIDETHLECAIKYNNLTAIECILNKKIIPTNKHFNMIIDIRNIPSNLRMCRKNKNQPIIFRAENAMLKYIIAAGYKITNDDILCATKKAILLDDDVIPEDYLPDKTIYKYCNKDFFPHYVEKDKKKYDVKLLDLYLKKSLCLTTIDIKKMISLIKNNKMILTKKQVEKINTIKDSSTKQKLLELLEKKI